MKSKIEANIQFLLEQSDVADYVKSPLLPEVLVNPSFLIVPELGRLVVICVYDLPINDKISEFALEIIEDVFEIKASTGPETSVMLILLEEYTPDHVNQFNFDLFDKLFDKVLRLRINYGHYDELLKRFIFESITEPILKAENISLWETDHQAREQNEAHIANKLPVKKLLEKTLDKADAKPSLENQPAIINQIISKMHRIENYTVIQNPKVHNIKELLLLSFTSYYFTFDFGLMPGHHDIEIWCDIDQGSLENWINMGSALVNVIRGAHTEYSKIKFLRRLSTFARFISYQANGYGNLELRNPPPIMYLVMDGNICGPAHDPQRYLRMLISSGWTPILLKDFIGLITEGGF